MNCKEALDVMDTALYNFNRTPAEELLVMLYDKHPSHSPICDMFHLMPLDEQDLPTIQDDQTVIDFRKVLL